MDLTDVKHWNNDAQWIREQLLKLPEDLRSVIAKRYSVAYQVSYDSEEFEPRRHNTARNRANKWLRKVVDKYQVQ